jgi:hypothetical protein
MSTPGSTRSPFRDGFAALWHEPALLPAELVWRWCFGFSAIALGVLSLGLFLDSLKISAADEFLLQTQQPRLLEEALQSIFRGSLSRFVLEQSILLLGMLLLWSWAATAGRAATLRRMVAMFSPDEEPQSLKWNFAPIFALQLLRAMWTIIALGVTTWLALYGVVMANHHRPFRAAIALSIGAGLASLAGVALNWYFRLAPLFCVLKDVGPMEGLERAVDFSERHAGRLFLLGSAFTVLRLLWAGSMCLAFLSPLSWTNHIDGRGIALLMAAGALVYFAGADLLYLAKLGAYASLAADDERPEPELVKLTPDVTPPHDVLPMVGLT